MADRTSTADVSAAGLGRLARSLWREAIRRPLPHGLVNWRYVQPDPPGQLSVQRSLWLASGPGLRRPAWAALEAWLWLRWQLWCGPSRVWRALRRYGSEVRAEDNLGLARQAWRVWSLSAAYCVPPAEIYRHRLYRRPNRPRVDELVYDHTVAAFHQARNSGLDEAADSLRLLADKEAQTAQLSALGVPMAPIVAVARRGSGEALASHMPAEGWCFCKPRHGSRGNGAFGARRDSRGLVVETLDGLRLRDNAASAYWARLLDDDDMIVQPRLSTHPDLADLAADDDVVTVRYISERGLGTGGHESDLGCYCASVELPSGRVGVDRRPAYVILDVDALTGAVKEFPPEWLFRDAARHYQRVYAALGRRTVPAWNRLCVGSHIAHAHFPGVHAIAWDWAVTPMGPLLLEGNSGWSAATPQMLRGGLLASPARLPQSRGGITASG